MGNEERTAAPRDWPAKTADLPTRLPEGTAVTSAANATGQRKRGPADRLIGTPFRAAVGFVRFRAGPTTHGSQADAVGPQAIKSAKIAEKWVNQGGHLLGGRYKAVLIDEGSPQKTVLYGYLGTVLYYVHLNPIRAGIVAGRSGKSLLDYRWSSLAGAYICSPKKRPFGRM